MTNKTYRLYPKAIEDIESIYLYSMSESGIKRTEDYILAIEASFRQLADDPLIARKCDYLRHNLRAFNVGVTFLSRCHQIVKVDVSQAEFPVFITRKHARDVIFCDVLTLASTICNAMTSGLNAADTDYDILMFVDQGNTRGSIVTADIDLEK